MLKATPSNSTIAPRALLPTQTPEVALERAKLRRRMERAIERLLAALDHLDGDPDRDEQCEDEGGACEDEGAQCEDEGAIEGL